MTRVLLVGGIWVLAVVILFFVGSLLYEWDALDRDRDGWCELLPGGAPSVDDPDCEGWDAGQSSQGGRRTSTNGEITQARHGPKAARAIG